MAWYEDDDEACTVSLVGGVTSGAVVVTGALDRDSDFRLRDAVLGALGRGWRTVAVDLSGVDFLSAGTVALLLGLQQRAAESGVLLHVTGARGLPARVLEIARVTELLAAPPAAGPEGLDRAARGDGSSGGSAGVLGA